MPDTTPAVHGRNEPTGADAAALFDQRVKNLVNAANAWAREVPTITTDDQARKCEDLLKQCLDEESVVDAERKNARRPHDNAIAEIQNRFNPLLDYLQACTVVLKRLKFAWLELVEERQKQARRKAEEAARLAQEEADMAKAREAARLGPAVQNRVAADAAQKAAEAAAAAAARAAAAKPQVVGEYGGRASGFTTVWSARITDWSKAATHYCNHPKVREAIQREANADAKRLHKALKVDGVEPVEGRRV